MTDLVRADDGLLAEEVGPWVRDKHQYLKAYVKISARTRAKYSRQGPHGVTFVDLFSSCGRAKIEGTSDYVDGSPLVAWAASSADGVPYSQIYVADRDVSRRSACEARLRAVGAPTTILNGDAVLAAAEFLKRANPYGLHFAFLDPHSLGALDFRIIENLARTPRIDMLIHVSAMDLRRNLGSELVDLDREQFDRFAPGWRQTIDHTRSATAIRAAILGHWKQKVEKLGFFVGTLTPMIKGTHGQDLYWLMFAAKHDLAHKFWTAIGRDDGQKALI